MQTAINNYRCLQNRVTEMGEGWYSPCNRVADFTYFADATYWSTRSDGSIVATCLQCYRQFVPGPDA